MHLQGKGQKEQHRLKASVQWAVMVICFAALKNSSSEAPEKRTKSLGIKHFNQGRENEIDKPTNESGQMPCQTLFVN